MGSTRVVDWSQRSTIGSSRGWGRRTQTTISLPSRSAQSVAIPPRTCLDRPEVFQSWPLLKLAGTPHG